MPNGARSSSLGVSRLMMAWLLSALAASFVADAIYYGYFVLFADPFFAQRVFLFWSASAAAGAVVVCALPVSLVLGRLRDRGLSVRRIRAACVALGAVVGVCLLLFSGYLAGPWFALFGGPLLPAAFVAGAVGGWVLSAVALPTSQSRPFQRAT